MNRLGWLDQWRVAATLYVVLYHAVSMFKDDGRAPSKILEIISGKGYLGTSFFMILSGFIITLIYRNKIGSSEKTFRFWSSRFARLAPPYFLLVLAVVFKDYFIDKDWIFDTENIINLFGNITLVSSLSPKAHLYLPQAWTLGVLAIFYVLFPWMCGKLTLCSRRQLLGVALSVWLVYLAVPVLYLLFTNEGPVGPFSQEPTIFEYLHKFPPLRVVEPFLGMLTAVYLTASQGSGIKLYQCIYWLSWLILGGALCLPNETFFFPILHNGICIPLILAMLASRYRISQHAVNNSVGKHMKVLADSTLGVYLSHMALLSITKSFSVNLMSSEIAILISMILVTVAGMLMQNWVFRPLGDRIAKWMLRRNDIPTKAIAIGD